MARPGDFDYLTKVRAYYRQDGVCRDVRKLDHSATAESLDAGPRAFPGEAHHLRPLHHGGHATSENCVYLCYACHKLVGHGTATDGIDKQGGSSQTWVKRTQSDFAFWNGKKR